MTKRTYPYTAWILSPSLKPVEVTLVRESWGGIYDETAKGKRINRQDTYKTKAAAIEIGHGEIRRVEAALEKRRINIEKKRAALAKALKEPA